MSLYVVDASVSLKWYVPEEDADAAMRLLEPECQLQAPDLFLSEIGNILWKKVRGNQLALEEALAILAAVRESSGIQLHPATPFAAQALAITAETDRTFYDSLYLALALALSCPLFTADARFYNALRTSRYATTVRWVTDDL